MITHKFKKTTLHGKATLILTDRETGREVFREEHENTLTPTLTRIFGTNLVGTLNYNKILPVISKLLGGVCLFNGSVNASDVFLPTAQAAQLTAHAGQNTIFDPATDPKRGYLNTALSGRTQDGYRWAWQWTTTGNGPITHIVLTHADTGDFWNESTPNIMEDYFEPLGDINNGVINPEEFTWSNDGGYEHISNDKIIPVGFIGNTNRVVTIEVKNDKLTVHIGKFTGAGAWIWNNLAEIEDEQTFDWVPTPFVWGNFENPGKCVFYIGFDGDNMKLYTFNAGTVEGGENRIYRPRSQVLTINTLDLLTGTASDTTIDCSSTLNNYSQYENTDPNWSRIDDGAVFYILGANQSGLLKQVQIVNGSVFLPVYWYRGGLGAQGGTTDCSIRVNITNTNDREIIKGFYDASYSGGDNDKVQVDLGNGRIMNEDTTAWKDTNGTYKGQKIKTNTSLFLARNNLHRAYAAKVPEDNPVQFFTYAGGTAAGVRGSTLNKLYAATVYTIENGPVVKTASLNMTLEYEITQEVES